jgi:imidazolonepropionase
MRGPQGPRRGTALNEPGMILDGALLIRDGVLVEVGPTRRVENLAQARQAVEISAVGRVVIPGFVDSHTHLAFPLRGPAIDESQAARAVRASTGQRLEARARAYLQAMARHGTTTVEVKTGCGPDESAECKVLRVLSALKQDPVEVIPSFLFRLPPDQEGGCTFHVAAAWVLDELLPKIRKRRVAHFADVAWDCDPERHRYFDRYLTIARELGFGCKIHADQLRPRAAMTTAVEHTVVSIDHLEYATESEAAILGSAGITATLLPCVSFREDRNAPARALIDSGAAVALASNFNPQHTPTLNMQTVVALACLRMGMTAAEALSAATINGAHALGCAQRVGSLELGKSADLLMLNVTDYRDLADTFGTNVVHMTMKRGEVIYQEGAVAPRPARQTGRPAPLGVQTTGVGHRTASDA